MNRWRGLLVAIPAAVLAGCQTVPPGAGGPVTKEMAVNGVTMKYVEQGRGEVVLLLPLGLSDSRAFESSREAVAGSYRYVSPTLRYFGRDPWPDGGANFSIATHVGDLAAFIRALDAGPVNVVGWSYGGGLGIVLALQHPELVKRLFLYEQQLVSWVTAPAEIAAIGAARKAAFGPAVVASKGGDQAAAARMVMDAAGGRPGSFDQLPPPIRTMFIDNARALPLLFGAPPPPPITCAQLGRLRMPVAIALGEATPVFYATPAREAHRCMPGSTLIVVPSERHFWPVHAPSAFTGTLFAFLKRQ